MITHLAEFRKHIAGLASADRYVRFLKDIAENSGQSITPTTLRSDDDIEAFAARLAPHYAEKSIANYRSVMRHYVDMVDDLGL